MVSWLSQTFQVLVSVFSWAESDHSWYVFFTLFSTYTLLPLPLLWSIIAGATTSTLHLLVDFCCHYNDHSFIRKVTKFLNFSWLLSVVVQALNCLVVHVQVLSKALLYLAMNTAGLFIHYLSDRTQRQSFLETRRCIEGRVRLERENNRQVRIIFKGSLIFCLPIEVEEVLGSFVNVVNLFIYSFMISVISIKSNHNFSDQLNKMFN